MWVGLVFSLGFYIALRVLTTETENALRRVNVLSWARQCPVRVQHRCQSNPLAVAAAVRKRHRSAGVFDIICRADGEYLFAARLGEFARAYLMGEAEADSKVYVLGTVAVEKVADLLFLLLSLMVLLSQMALPEWLIGPARGTALLIAILVPCFVLLAWQRDFFLRMVEWTSRFVPSAWREGLVRQTRYGLASLDVVRRPRLLIGCSSGH